VAEGDGLVTGIITTAGSVPVCFGGSAAVAAAVGIMASGPAPQATRLGTKSTPPKKNNNERIALFNIPIPNHRRIKGSTLRTILTQAQISRDDFLEIFHED